MPGLSTEEEQRVRAGFAAVESQQVEVTITSIDIQGDRAFVRLSRRDTIVINGGQQTRASDQSITLTRTASGWVIAELGQ